MAKEQDSAGVETVSKGKAKTQRPKMYKVILLNDDYTTMDFVVAILETIFKKSPAEAVQIMLNIHNTGRGVCGIFSKQIAEAKMKQVHDRARADGFPLRCSLEEE